MGNREYIIVTYFYVVILVCLFKHEDISSENKLRASFGKLKMLRSS